MTQKKMRRYLVAASLWTLVLTSMPFMLAQGEQSKWDVETSTELRALDSRLGRVEATHPEAIVEAVRAQGEAIKSQQTLLWGVLAAVLINIITNNLKFDRRASPRRAQEEDV